VGIIERRVEEKKLEKRKGWDFKLEGRLKA